MRLGTVGCTVQHLECLLMCLLLLSYTLLQWAVQIYKQVRATKYDKLISSCGRDATHPPGRILKGIQT